MLPGTGTDRLFFISLCFDANCCSEPRVNQFETTLELWFFFFVEKSNLPYLADFLQCAQSLKAYDHRYYSTNYTPKDLNLLQLLSDLSSIQFVHFSLPIYQQSSVGFFKKVSKIFFSLKTICKLDSVSIRTFLSDSIRNLHSVFWTQAHTFDHPSHKCAGRTNPKTIHTYCFPKKSKSNQKMIYFFLFKFGSLSLCQTFPES